MKQRTSVRYTVSIELTECEARALESFAAYGTEGFLEAFYKHLGRCQLAPYEAGVRTLFDRIAAEVRPELRRVDQMRKLLEAAT